MSPRTKAKTFQTRGEVRTHLEHRLVRIVTGGSREAADKALARGIPLADHWGLVGTEGTADRGEVGKLIGSVRWDEATGLVHVTMADRGELPPKGRKAWMPGPKYRRFTVRIRTEDELPRYRSKIKALFVEFAAGRRGCEMTVDGVLYSGAGYDPRVGRWWSVGGIDGFAVCRECGHDQPKASDLLPHELECRGVNPE